MQLDPKYVSALSNKGIPLCDGNQLHQEKSQEVDMEGLSERKSVVMGNITTKPSSLSQIQKLNLSTRMYLYFFMCECVVYFVKPSPDPSSPVLQSMN